MKKEYDLKKMKEIKNPYKGKIKKSVGINLSPEVIDYFKQMSLDLDIPYQKLIDMYLLDCVEKKRKLDFKWTA
jgi:predicted DNA binding CopG/RHH family protein